MASDEKISLLLNRWVHSHEEDDGERLVFRPAEYPFPRARMARQAMDLGEEGEAEVELHGPADGSSSVGGWSLEGDFLKVTTPEFAGEYELDSVDEEILVLRRLKPKGR